MPDMPSESSLSMPSLKTGSTDEVPSNVSLKNLTGKSKREEINKKKIGSDRRVHSLSDENMDQDTEKGTTTQIEYAPKKDVPYTMSKSLSTVSSNIGAIKFEKLMICGMRDKMFLSFTTINRSFRCRIKFYGVWRRYPRN